MAAAGTCSRRATDSTLRWGTASGDGVRRLIEEQKEKGWEFLFLGANIDAVEAARNIGIPEQRAVNFMNDAVGIGKVYRALGRECCRFSVEAKLDEAWCLDIREDYGRRSGEEGKPAAVGKRGLASASRHR